MMTQLDRLNKVQRLLILQRHRGLLRRVAQQCGVDSSLVSRVFHGKASSPHHRVRKALEAELEKLLKGDHA